VATYQRKPGEPTEAFYDASEEFGKGAAVFSTQPDYVVAPEGLVTVEQGARLEIREIRARSHCPMGVCVEMAREWRVEQASSRLKFTTFECRVHGFVWARGWIS